MDNLEVDAAVARAEIAGGALDVRLSDTGTPTIMAGGGWEPFRPSVNWAHAGPIIESHEICLACAGGRWVAFLLRSPDDVSRGPTPLIAAMRAYVACKP
jgi:hypothetical protein